MGERSYLQGRDRYDWKRVGERMRARVMPFIGEPAVRAAVAG
jgi:hypothetical protein